MIGLQNQGNNLIKIFLVLLLLSCNEAFAQKYAQKLHVKAGEIFQLKGNSFEIDTLILEDGAELLLDKNHKGTEIIAGHLYLGVDCLITGNGLNGEHAGFASVDQTVNHFGTVRNYKAGYNNGLPGISACDLTLFVKSLTVKGRFAVNLKGGDGGNANRKAGIGGDGGNFIFSFPRNSRETVLANAAIFTQGGHGGEILVNRKNLTSNFAHDGRQGVVEYIDLAGQ